MTVKINADTSDGLKFVSDTSGAIDFQSNGTTKVSMNSTGNLTLEHPDTPSITFTDTTNTVTGQISAGNSDFNIQTNTDHSIDIRPNNVRSMQLFDDTWIAYTGGTERMRILSSGKICFGSTTAESTSEDNMQIDPSGGNVYMYQNTTALQGVFDFRNPNGYIGSIRTTGTSTQFNTSSDYRLKENIDYTFDATTELKRLKPCKFNFIADADTTVEGFIAHEVAEVVPHAISGEKDATRTQNIYDDEGNITGTETVPDYQQIDQSKLVPLLVKTIQELEARITALENN